VGLHAFFAYPICGSMGFSWQAGLAAVFLSGIIFILITVTGLRTAIVNAIPMSLKKAISGGIGLFIAFIGFKNAGIVVSSESTSIALGTFNNPTVILSVIGLIITIALVVWKVKGSLLIGIAVTSIIGAIMQYALGFNVGMPEQVVFSFNFDFSATGAFASGFGELFSTGKGIGVLIFSIISVLLSLTMVDMFDTIGTLVGAASKGGFLDKDGNLPRANRALLADLRTHSLAEGGSTLTQQLAKNELFTQEKQMARKAAEMFAARDIEDYYSKQQIFEMYAGSCYFGNQWSGVAQAAQGYFGKPTRELTSAECVVLAGLPNAPSVYAANGELARRRALVVVERMERAKKRFAPEDLARLEYMLRIVSNELMPEIPLPELKT